MPLNKTHYSKTVISIQKKKSYVTFSYHGEHSEKNLMNFSRLLCLYTVYVLKNSLVY